MSKDVPCKMITLSEYKNNCIAILIAIDRENEVLIDRFRKTYSIQERMLIDDQRIGLNFEKVFIINKLSEMGV